MNKSIDEYTEQKFKWNLEHLVDQPKNIKDGVKGYCAADIIYFCNQHKIKCYGYDWKMNQFISNKHENINFNKNIPAFVFYYNDYHVYLINNTQMRIHCYIAMIKVM